LKEFKPFNRYAQFIPDLFPRHASRERTVERSVPKN
jgi:hypothetical protein